MENHSFARSVSLSCVYVCVYMSFIIHLLKFQKLLSFVTPQLKVVFSSTIIYFQCLLCYNIQDNYNSNA